MFQVEMIELLRQTNVRFLMKEHLENTKIGLGAVCVVGGNVGERSAGSN